MVASANLGTTDIEFENKYVANPVSKSIDGEKVLHGKTLVLGQFVFELWESNSDWAKLNAEPIQTVANNSEGNFAFNFVNYTNNNATDFTKAGSYYYLINEVNGGKANVTYSAVEYAITVTIELDENNDLVATLTKNGKKEAAVFAEFENIYDYTPVPEYPDSPQTGDITNLHLWFTLLFVSSGGVLGTTLYGRKRKEEEGS